ncbi:DUF5063 domain-containing protein [Aggregicoccus sp. 17bor-14]|uniref:DUF5063 domain-containing protein n=1 Tax=Myxococcaceae TaxID=31 RepID=UPI00129CEADA|nr:MULTISPECIES: DUF5063 domain-containing protein [Myxococcaceae]MBF5045420.1 DUF5063 domain-containing protein [Simulacricoccus sp. 17bor-14]MRI91161.1 DUF5063 domain-containing protein [Aggregicoccus sp. 17bor-14]
MGDAEREAALRLALDRLALAQHFAHGPGDERRFPEPALTPHDALRARLGPLFPGLGLYDAVLESTEHLGEPELGIGDALDDLIDIARELEGVLLRWESTSEADALWHLRFGFDSHWGKHLRSLQLYLHRRAR